ncbi:phage holin family protein [Antribacter gilvus]|uniref:phage holin family protein n=1 Tax=Antribacter gilvus TaxID=2304675 RepID=UPI000F795305|nr:phage holin family protein [Antribacter gilvus]
MSTYKVTDAPADDRPASLGKLVEQLTDQVSRLARAEIALAKAELSEKAKRSGIGAGLVIGALVIVLYAVGVLIWAAVLGLGTAWPLWLSALVIGVFLLLVAAGLVLAGVKLLKKASTPPETVQRVKDDISTIKEGMHR